MSGGNRPKTGQLKHNLSYQTRVVSGFRLIGAEPQPVVVGQKDFFSTSLLIFHNRDKHKIWGCKSSDLHACLIYLMMRISIYIGKKISDFAYEKA